MTRDPAAVGYTALAVSLVFPCILLLACQTEKSAQLELERKGLNYQDGGSLTQAVRNNQHDIVDLFLRAGFDPNVGVRDGDENGANLLLVALDVEILRVRRGNPSDLTVVRALLEHGANPNERIVIDSLFGSGNVTPMVLAVQRPDLLRLLLEHGGDPNTTVSMQGTSVTLLEGAKRERQEESIAILQAAGAR